MTFKAYMENIQKELGKRPEDFWRLAAKKGFIKNGKIVAAHAQLPSWLKFEIGLGHVRANMIILYLRIRAKDPKVSDQMGSWARKTWKF